MARPYVPPRVTLKRNLEMLLELHEMSGPELAVKAGVDRKTVNNWLNQKFFPSLPELQQVAQVFGLNYWMLILHELPQHIAKSPKGFEKLMELAQEMSEEDLARLLGVAEMAAKPHRKVK